jgi:hypothetical protein
MEPRRGFRSESKQLFMSKFDLYDWYVCVRGGIVEDLWAITARGALA